MWPFKKKIVIKETKSYPYGRMRQDMSNYSVWDNMSIIEKFALIGLPIMMCFIFYMMCDAIIPDLKWWYRLPISVGGVSVVTGLVTIFSNWITGEN